MTYYNVANNKKIYKKVVPKAKPKSLQADVTAIKSLLNKVAKKGTLPRKIDTKVYKPKGKRNRRRNAMSKFALDKRVGDNFKFLGMTLDYLNLVVDPLDCINVARMPDPNRSCTMPLIDFYPATQPVFSAWDGNADMYGVIIFWSFGWNSFWQNNRTMLGLYAPYQIMYALVDQNGYMVSAADSNYIGGIPFTNADAIFPDGPSVDPVTNVLASQIRQLSFGMRILPSIEINTNSSQLCMSKIYGGQLTIESLYNGFWEGGNSINNVVQQYGAIEFQNTQGCCVRFNPFSMNDQMAKFATFNDVNGVLDTTDDNVTPLIDWGKTETPFIYIKFSLPLASTSYDISTGISTYVMPFYLDARLILEAILAQPTPLYATPSPIDPNWPKVLAIMNSIPQTTLPFVTQGHSFKSFMEHVGKVVNYADKFLKYGSDIIQPIQQIYSTSARYFM
jgi:hypothetical protein